MLQLVDVSLATIRDYAPLVGAEVIDRLERLAAGLKGARILHVNATPYGGGVSELLRSSVAIQRGLGLNVDWRVISGSEAFFAVTKNIHNALQGAAYNLTSEAKETYLLQNNYNARQMEGDYDFVMIHDPQPAAMLHLRGHDSRHWVWRCHIDTSHPNEEVLQFLLPFIDEYDALVFTMDQFVPDSLRDRVVYLIPPGIDPLSPKNFDIPKRLSHSILSWVGVRDDQPLLTQVSRFDPWKDPLGVVRVYRRVSEEIPNLQLALLGSLALDDPQGWGLLREVQAETRDDPRILVATNLTGISNIEVNVFQRQSDVVLQKSIREGFGLIVSETLWKGTPMVAGKTGGIPMQMPEGVGGYLIDPTDEDAMAEHVVHLLQEKKLARKLGRSGREHIRQHFLITRMIEQELSLFNDLASGK